ncbi:MAG TPA: protein kinase, partial [Gemmataceae bacterium]|nr:protein kinase [Gemmataceae bacterium]
EPQTKLETVPAGLYTRLWTQLPDALMLFLPAFAAVMSLFGAGILQLDGFPLFLNGFAAGLVMYLIWETLLGWTPGRRLRGFRLLDAAGERPPRWRLLVRCLFRLAWVFVVVYAMEQSIAELLRLVGSEQHALLEKILKAFVGFGMIVVFPLLAAAVLYWTGRWTPDGRPVHDYLTGISWYQHRAKREEHILEAVDVDRRRLPTKTGPTTSSSSATGKVLGRMDQYELRGLIGQGGMGAVYEALDTLLERRVAIKVLSSSISATSTVLQRFEREARLAAQLSHPNVAQVYGVGEAASQPYMVMEFVDGEDLQKHVQREGPLPLARAWDYVKQTALALREAANHGIVHRDIKPANLILAGNDIVKVTDFGISRAFGDEKENPESAAAAFSRLADVSLTSTGALLGTPQYFSPEQARAEKLDSRSDIYSLGMTLYFLVSGRPPFEGSDLLDLVMRQCNEEPTPLLGSVAGWTPERNDLLQRMIAKDRADRFQDYDELLKGLESTAPRPPTLAGLGRRASAEVINLLLAICFSWAPWLFCSLLFTNHSIAEAMTRLLNEMLFAAIYIVGIGRWGTTPGKWLLHLKVVRPDSPQIGYRRAFVRFLVLYPVILGMAVWSLRTFAGGKDLDSTEPWFVLTITLLLINCCLILFGARRRGLHDLAAGTLVIRLPDEPGRWGRLFKSLSLRWRLHF